MQWYLGWGLRLWTMMPKGSCSTGLTLPATPSRGPWSLRTPSSWVIPRPSLPLALFSLMASPSTGWPSQWLTCFLLSSHFHCAFILGGMLCRVLYWTDTHNGEIYVSTEDGRYKKTLMKRDSGPSSPHAIAVNPRSGCVVTSLTVYWLLHLDICINAWMPTWNNHSSMTHLLSVLDYEPCVHWPTLIVLIISETLLLIP